MKKENDRRIVDLAITLQLEKSARSAKNLRELSFIITNETFRLVPYTSAFLWLFGDNSKVKILSASGVEVIDDSLPAIRWLKKLIPFFASMKKGKETYEIKASELPPKVAKIWAEWSPERVLWCPINMDGKIIGGLWLSRSEEWDKQDINLLEILVDAYAHAMKFFIKKDEHKSWFEKSSKKIKIALAIIALLSFTPVSQTVLSPAEVIPVEAYSVNVPVNGVIKKVIVEPNQKVRVGEELFRLDETGLKNKYEISLRTLDVAEAELKKTQQLAFSRADDQANVALLRSKIEQQKAEAEYTKALLDKLVVYAERDGVAVFSDKNDLEGRPVSIGQKVMSIADAGNVELLMFVPAEDAVQLNEGTEVKAFLNISPLSGLNARIRNSAYEPSISPDGGAVYKVRASITDKTNLPRIGLKATAKIYGDKVPLVYYLFRRPLAYIRHKIGF